jgi:hypothetical protein
VDHVHIELTRRIYILCGLYEALNYDV